ncbi:hypothetical protein [Natronorubrum sp. A-ect3]|uniref:hypothetical protein n=1 Tax=Natronorubrum sp. A-ect3 TaxID=3242698 RepID=UPI00359E958C
MTRAIQSHAVTYSSDGVLAVVVPDLSRALGVTIGWMLLTLVLGAVLIGGVPSRTQAIRAELTSRPDLVFPAGFIVFFGLLAVASMPLFVAMVLEHPLVFAVGAVVTLPTVALWGVLLVVGGCFGVLAVGDWLVGRVGYESPSPWSSLVVGTLVIGSSQLVPVLGAVMLLGVATIGTGAIVRRRLGPDGGDESLTGTDDEPVSAPTVSPATDDGSAVKWETTSDPECDSSE